MPIQVIETYKNGELIESREVPISVAQHNAGIIVQLEAIDAKSIRALREGNTQRIATLEIEAATLRQQLLTP